MASAQPKLSLLSPAIKSGELGIPALKECNSVLDLRLLHNFFMPDGIRMDGKLVRPCTSCTGRQLQRYSSGRRQIVGCVPYRYRKTKESTSMNGLGSEDLEVLVISSQKGRVMLFPKGGWEHGESKEEAAVRETMEEAGVVGTIGCQLGRWEFMSKDQGRNREGYMFPLLVEKQLEDWPEKNVRRRMWMKAGEAREVCKHEWMKEALDKLVHRFEAKLRNHK